MLPRDPARGTRDGPREGERPEAPNAARTAAFLAGRWHHRCTCRAIIMRSAPGLLLLGACAALAACSGNTASQGVCDTSEALGVESVCAGSTTLKGIDVSTYQGAVNWSSVKSSGIQFAFARISDGTANPDNQFEANWKGMKAEGIVRGSYQYWRAGVDPTAQANLVISSLKNAGGMVAGDLPVVMDIETNDGVSSQSTIIANMQTWLAAVEKGTGIKPIIYTSIGTYPITSTMFSSYVLWVANYGVSCPSIPAGWTKWAFWQNADTGVAGGDSDEFNGTLAELGGYTLMGGSGSSSGGSSSGSSSGGSSGSSSGGTKDDGGGTGSSSGSGSGSSSGGKGSGSGGKGGKGGSSSGGDAGATMGAGGSGGDVDAGTSGSSSGCGG